MALLQLVATGFMDKYHEEQDEQKSYEMKEFKLENDEHFIQYECDVVKIYNIIFETKENITIDEFIECVSKTSFGLIIGDIEIYEYDINLLINFNEIVKINNKFIIKIPEFLNFVF